MNYIFVLLPAALVLVSGRMRKPSGPLLLAMIFYTLIYGVGLVYQHELLPEWGRRTSSFILFMSMFAFLFIHVDETMVRAFKLAVISISVAFSLKGAYVFLAQGGAQLGFDAKDLVGSQRYGFIYLLALWTAYRSNPPALSLRLAKWGAIVIIMVGLALTFSRASMVALAAGIFLFLGWSLFGLLQRIDGRRLLRLAAGGLALAAGVLMLAAVVQAYFPVLPKFFDATLVELFRDREAFGSTIGNESSSEGIRMVIWRQIVAHVAANPVTGAGFLGVWILDSVVASAHNQYMDVLFRTGFVGLLVYLAILLGIARKLRALGEAGLFWGFVAMLAYGMFHETFKESQGAFALAFLLGMPGPVSRAGTPD